MQITEKHIEKIYNSLEKFAADNAKGNIAYDAIIFAAGMFKCELITILKSSSEEQLQKSKEFANKAMKILDEKISTDEKVEKIFELAEKKAEKDETKDETNCV